MKALGGNNKISPKTDESSKPFFPALPILLIAVLLGLAGCKSMLVGKHNRQLPPVSVNHYSTCLKKAGMEQPGCQDYFLIEVTKEGESVYSYLRVCGEYFKVNISVECAPGTVTKVDPKGAAPAATPVFDWDAKGTEGLSMKLSEKFRNKGNGATTIVYNMKPGGFKPGTKVEFWQKKREKYLVDKLEINDQGDLQLTNGPSMQGVVASGFIPGEPFEVTVYDPASGAKAKARHIPFPIEASGKGGCHISVEVATPYVVAIWIKGFKPKEKVQVTSRYKDERATLEKKVGDNGSTAWVIMFGPPDRGKARTSAKGKDCSVELEYPVGDDLDIVQ